MSAFKAVWLFGAVVAVVAIIVMLGVLINQGSKAPPAPEMKTECTYTPSAGYDCWQVRK